MTTNALLVGFSYQSHDSCHMSKSCDMSEIGELLNEKKPTQTYKIHLAQIENGKDSFARNLKAIQKSERITCP